MKSTLLFIFFITPRILFSQTDSLKGNIKSVREKLIFIDSTIQNRKLWSSEGEYGHYGFTSPEFTFSRFNSWWYNTSWCHYLNYYREFDSSRKLISEIWFYKNGEILEKYFYRYDERNNLIQKKNSYDDSTFYTTNSKFNYSNKLSSTISFSSETPDEYRYESYIYDSLNRLDEIKYFNEDGESFGKKYEYNLIGKLSKDINHSPYVWINIDKKTSQAKFDNVGTDYLNIEYIYDSRNNVIIEKHYIKNSYDQSKVTFHRIIKFKYDNRNRKIEEYYGNANDSTNDAYREYEYYENNLIKLERFINTNGKKIITEILYYYNNKNNVEKVVYKNEKSKSIINFEYKFDNNNNWIEETKIVNSKPLYLRKRKIVYY